MRGLPASWRTGRGAGAVGVEAWVASGERDGGRVGGRGAASGDAGSSSSSSLSSSPSDSSLEDAEDPEADGGSSRGWRGVCAAVAPAADDDVGSCKGSSSSVRASQ